jgi:acyl-CoA dehydrogenase
MIAALPAYALNRKTFGKPLAERQIMQFRLGDLFADVAMVRNFVMRTAWELDRSDPSAISHLVSICNYKANRLACRAADEAIQIHGGIGYSRAKPFEHIYRHHRRYRITEGADEIQMRNISAALLGRRRADSSNGPGAGGKA